MQELIGYAFESSDLVDIPGFSGDNVNLLIGMNTRGQLVGSKLLNHHEPIFLHGLGETPLIEFIDQFKGLKVNQRIIIDGKHSGSRSDESVAYIDGVTKATVSVVVVNDTIISSALKVARQKISDFVQGAPVKIRPDYFEPLSLDELMAGNYIKKWVIKRDEAEHLLGASLSDFPDESLDLDEDNMVIYYAYLNPPIIGENLIGLKQYEKLFNGIRLTSDEHAVLIMSKGFYSYIDEDFKPGTTPDRISLSQGSLPIPLRDVNFFDTQQIQRDVASGVVKDFPDEFNNMRIFKIKPQTGFNPGEEFNLELNMVLSNNHLVSERVKFSDSYKPPESLFEAVEINPSEYSKPALWKTIWRSRIVEIIVLCLSLVILTLAIIYQHRLTANSRRFTRFRWVFLFFTLFFIGIYSQGQLSVVNILTIFVSIFDDFNIETFLLDPFLFILWCYTMVTLFLWGRGIFCGWLCPFGALQEMVAWMAGKLSIRQIKIKAANHKKLILLKYGILIGLVGVAFHSLTLAEQLSEVEPFKTAITLTFVRYWPFVIYALVILAAGLFIHKFYCRYLCPLGAGLAILGKFHVFEWLNRREECGNPCHACKSRCGINAIDQQGRIDYNECIQCLECIVILNNKDQCVPEILKTRRMNRSQNDLTNLLVQ